MSVYCANETCGLYRCFDEDLRLLYVGVSLNVAGRTARHAKKPWMMQVSEIKVEWFPNGKRALKAERRAIKVENPAYNKRSTGAFSGQRELDEDWPPTKSEVMSIWTCLRMEAERSAGSDALDAGELSSVTSISYFDVLAIMNFLCDCELTERLKCGGGRVRYRICDQTFEPIRDLGISWRLGDELTK